MIERRVKQEPRPLKRDLFLGSGSFQLPALLSFHHICQKRPNSGKSELVYLAWQSVASCAFILQSTPSVLEEGGPLLRSFQLLALLNPTLDEFEALSLIVGQTGLEQHGVHAELRVQQRHVAVHLDKEVDALVALVEMRVVVRQSLRAAGAAEGPTGSHLEETVHLKLGPFRCNNQC